MLLKGDLEMSGFTHARVSRRTLLGVMGVGLSGGAGFGNSPSEWTAASVVKSGYDLQNSIDDAVRRGRELELGPATYVCRQPLLITSGLKMRLSQGTVLIKAFSNDGGTLGSFIRNRDFSRKVKDVEITGPGIIRAESVAQRGNILALFGDRVRLSGWSIDRWSGGRAVIIAGDSWRVRRLSIGGSPAESGSGGIRMMGGNNNFVRDCQVSSGDDAFQFVPSASPSDPLYDRSLADCAFVDCSGTSTNARLMVAALIAPRAKAGEQVLTASISNCRFQRVSGTTSQVGAVAVFNSNSSGVIQNVRVLDSIVQAARTGYQPALIGSALVAASSKGGVRKVRLHGLEIQGQPQSALVINGYVDDTRVTGCAFERDPEGSTPVAVVGGRRTVVLRSRFEGRGAARDVVQVRKSGGPVNPLGVTIGDGCLVRGIATGGVGLRVGASTESRVVSTTFRGDAGAPAVWVSRAAQDALVRDLTADGRVIRG